MANIKISQLVLATPGPNSVFPFTDSGATFKGFVSGLTTNYIEVTKNELDSLVITSSLIPGYFYIITGVDTELYGGTTIILEAVSTTELSETGVGLFYNPIYNQTTDGYGVWNRYVTMNFDSITNGPFTPGETVINESGGTATYIGDELLNFINGDWFFTTSITGNTSGAEAIISNVIAPFYTVNNVIWGGKVWELNSIVITGETLSVGDGTNTYSGYTQNYPINQSSLQINASIEQFSDNGLGVLTGDNGGVGTINYDTGEWVISCYISVPTGNTITGDYIAYPLGDSLNKYELSSIWSEIPYNTTNYDLVSDEIVYDYTKDKIISRKDSYGNEVSCTYQSITQFELNQQYNLGNPIKDFQWGNNQTNWGVTPGLYLFNDVQNTSGDINIGGNDMFDIGNTLNTELFTQVPYTHTQMTQPPINENNEAPNNSFIQDGIVSSGDTYFGAGSEYFTNLYPGVFVMGADNINVNRFYIDGGVGADCNSELDSYQQTYTGFSETYTVFVKRFFNNTNLEPSNNHIIIVNSDGTGIVHDFNSGGCDSDYHEISGLTSSNVTKVYYLLMSLYPNEKINDTTIDEIVNIFLNIVDNKNISDSLNSLNTSYSELTSQFGVSSTLSNYGVMGNKVIDSYMDCLNFMGGYIWNNTLTQNSIFSDNVFSPIRVPYFSFNNLIQDSKFSSNIITSNSDFSFNSLLTSEVTNNNFSSRNTTTTNIRFNKFDFSYLDSNLFHDSLLRRNIVGQDSEIINNQLIDSTILNNEITNNSSLDDNNLVDSSIVGNTLYDSTLNQNILVFSQITDNFLNSSVIDNNDLLNNGNINNNVLDSISSIISNTVYGNSYIEYNTISQNSNIESNNLDMNSYLNYNSLFYSKLSGNSLDDSSFIQENRLTNYSEISENTLLTAGFVSNNVIENGSYILSNNVENGSEILENTLSVGYIYQNTMSAGTISRNILNINSEIYLNGLNASNIWKNNLTSESSVYNGNLDNSLIQFNSLKNTTVNLLSSCIIDTKNIVNTNFVDSQVNDISENSDVIYQSYSKNVFTNSTGGTRISYYDSSDTLVIGNINDSILPTLNITGWTAVSSYNVDVYINITLDGGNSVTERGSVWGINPYPTIADNIVVEGGTGTGNYTSSLTGLTSGTTIYFRGYAVNSSGTGYTCQDSYNTP